MTLERVSFKVAKSIKEAGYPQGQEEYAYRSNGDIYIFENMFDHISDYCCDAPFVMEVRLWLWREKKIIIEHIIDGTVYINIPNDKAVQLEEKYFDPEEAIIAAIEYLVDNDLIK